jgi:hypothetical protein
LFCGTADRLIEFSSLVEDFHRHNLGESAVACPLGSSPIVVSSLSLKAEHGLSTSPSEDRGAGTLSDGSPVADEGAAEVLVSVEPFEPPPLHPASSTEAATGTSTTATRDNFLNTQTP